MSKLPMKDLQGKAAGEYDISDDLLTFDKGLQAVQDAVVNYRANIRQGSASTLGKGEVAGSGKKLWKQKGTGRARTGLRQSPVWRGGGVVFGPKPRDYNRNQNRREARLAFRRAFSEKIAAGQVIVVEDLSVAQPKTREFAALMTGLGVRAPAIFVTDAVNTDVVRAARNIPRVEVTTADSLHTYQVLRYPTLVITRAAMAVIEERLLKAKGGKA
ncbi:MAG: 50S ribosomal protein L4 [Verrucomicrobia bacterium]|nr:50S ribosomal protein L4 [Verrucomicrobiota bacterium]MCH8514494.1 50S ribosomal protein L4 [Kiritimatiellia bacterium]